MKDDSEKFWFQGRDPKRVAEDEAEIDRLLPRLVVGALVCVAVLYLLGFN